MGTFKTPLVKVLAPEFPVVVKLVNVAVAGVGIFKVPLLNVAAPVPVVVSVTAFCLPLKIFQSADVKYPLALVVAAGIDTVLVLLDNGPLKVNGTSYADAAVKAAVPNEPPAALNSEEAVTPLAKVVPVIFAAVKLVKLAPLMAGNEVTVKVPVLSILALPLKVTGAWGAPPVPVK